MITCINLIGGLIIGVGQMVVTFGDAARSYTLLTVQDNIQRPANVYAIRLKEIEAGRGDLRPGMLLVMDPKGEPISPPGEDTNEPTFGLPARWINENLREEASFRGLTVVDPATVLATPLTEIIKDNLAELLSYTETQKLLDEIAGDYQKLLDDLVPNRITVGGIQRVLQALPAERISLRDLAQIMEAVSEAVGWTQNPVVITEHARSRLARQISNAHTSEAGFIPIVTLSADWEQAFGDALVGQGEQRQLAMAPSELQQFIGRLRGAGRDRPPAAPGARAGGAAFRAAPDRPRARRRP
ncbi:MAG TPA: FHIPEP family type III secretion protein [Geminicoccaceae bacterium]